MSTGPSKGSGERLVGSRLRIQKKQVKQKKSYFDVVPRSGRIGPASKVLQKMEVVVLWTGARHLRIELPLIVSSDFLDEIRTKCRASLDRIFEVHHC